MRELWLIRHGETAWNAERRWQGHTDVALSSVGEAQARRLAARLAGVSFDRVVSSDLVRATRTAALALPHAAVGIDVRLREMNFGTWEGRSWHELEADDPHGLGAWLADPYVFCPPAGESFPMLMARARSWLAGLPPGRTAAVTHGGVIRALVHGFLGVPAGHAWRLAFDNCGITRLHVSDRGTTLQCLNDCGHLAERELR